MPHIFFETTSEYVWDGFTKNDLIEKETHVRVPSGQFRVNLTSKNIVERGVMGHLVLELEPDAGSTTGMKYRAIVDTYQAGNSGYYQRCCGREARLSLTMQDDPKAEPIMAAAHRRNALNASQV